MRCVYCGHCLTTGERIVKLLSTPKTVTELKRKLPEISSLGTLAYHLKILSDSGFIESIKDKTKRGSPTTYKQTVKAHIIFNSEENLTQEKP